MSSNLLAEIPCFIGNLNLLVELKLYNQKIQSLPEEIGNLENLKLLDICVNRISRIPESISNLTALQSLHLTWNDIEEFPNFVPPQLKNLYIGGNSGKFNITSFGSTKVHIKTVLPDKITNNIWLGAMIAGNNKHYLKSQGITHVLSVLNDYQPTYPEDFKYKIISIEDVPGSNIKDYFNEAIEFINSAVESNGRVFVHCAAGISRSSTIVIAYMMKTEQLTFKKAFKLVQSRRPVIAPNYGFKDQLLLWEKELVDQKAKCNIS